MYGQSKEAFLEQQEAKNEAFRKQEEERRSEILSQSGGVALGNFCNQVSVSQAAEAAAFLDNQERNSQELAPLTCSSQDFLGVNRGEKEKPQALSDHGAEDDGDKAEEEMQEEVFRLLDADDDVSMDEVANLVSYFEAKLEEPNKDKKGSPASSTGSAPALFPDEKARDERAKRLAGRRRARMISDSSDEEQEDAKEGGGANQETKASAKESRIKKKLRHL